MLVCFNPQTGNGCGTLNRDGARFCRNCGASLQHALHLKDPNTTVRTYCIERLIGYGGYGAVYVAIDERYTNRRIALKETFDPLQIRTFADEFSILNNLQHPNLPDYLDVFEEDAQGYLVMEFVPGQSLRDVLNKQRRPLLESQVLGFALQLCDVLSYLHSQHPAIIHRDVKPDNVRLTPEGLIKLVDFGLHKIVDEKTQQSRQGLTPGYAPLEQWRGGEKLTDPRSDIYSLGATLYHLLTAHKPAPATDRIVSFPDPVLNPRRYNSSLSPAIADAIVKAMSVAQNDRFNDALEFKHSLLSGAQFLSGAGILSILEGHQAGTLCVAWHPEGHLLLSGAKDNTIRIWDTQRSDMYATLTGHTDAVSCIAWRNDGQVFASGSRDKTIRLWNTSETATIHTLTGHTRQLYHLVYQPHGSHLASIGGDRTVRVWQLSDSTPCITLNGPKGSINGLDWSPDGKFLASHLMNSNQICVWDSTTGKLHQLLRERMSRRMMFAILEATYLSASVAYAPDGQIIASGSSADHTVRLWAVDEGILVGMLEGHQAPITSVDYSPDGQTLASASLDRTIRLWSVADGRLLYTLEGHLDIITSIAYSPDGQTLASASLDKTIRLWRV